MIGWEDFVAEHPVEVPGDIELAPVLRLDGETVWLGARQFPISGFYEENTPFLEPLGTTLHERLIHVPAGDYLLTVTWGSGTYSDNHDQIMGGMNFFTGLREPIPAFVECPHLVEVGIHRDDAWVTRHREDRSAVLGYVAINRLVDLIDSLTAGVMPEWALEEMG